MFKKITTTFILLVLLILKTSAQENLSCLVFFSIDNQKVVMKEKSKIKNFVKQINTRQNFQISIIGYTDDAGREKYNDTLSLLRAREVKKILTEFGIKKDQINFVAGKGELQINDSFNKSLKQQRIANRKVSVIVTYNPKLKYKKSLLDNLNVGDKLILDGILFIGGRAVLLPESKYVLDSLTRILQLKKDYCIVIMGHIHSIDGDPPKGKDGPDHDTGLPNLSVSRAKAIYNHFIKNGISTNRLSYVGLKGDFPISNDGKYNRRVEIQIKKISNLDKNKGWQQLIERTKKETELSESKFNRRLMATLDTIYKEDQECRQKLEEIESKYGWDSKQATSQWKVIYEKDSLHLLKLKPVLDQQGWIGVDEIGYYGSAALFIVIQHAPLKEQLTYLPHLRVAVKNNQASPSNLALLEDRVALQLNRKQIYGSQIEQDVVKKIYFVAPLSDPDHVDERRAAVGLGPLSSYLINWGITWNVAQYKKELSHKELRSNK